MRYMLLIYGEEDQAPDVTSEQWAEGLEAYGAFTEAISGEGILRGGDALDRTATATTIRVRDGREMITDGPFAETREQLGGYYLIECDSLDQAIAAARRVPGARWGSVEVRPVLELG